MVLYFIIKMIICETENTENQRYDTITKQHFLEKYNKI